MTSPLPSKQLPDFQRMSNDCLLEELAKLVASDHDLTALLIAHIGAVDDRRLYRREACSSMFAYCTEVLHMSEDVAYTRIRAARTARRFPVVLEMLGRGEIHLTAIRILAPHLTPQNHLQLLGAATHKSKKQVEELAADCAPRPDVPARIRKLPAPRCDSADPVRSAREVSPLTLGVAPGASPGDASPAASGDASGDASPTSAPVLVETRVRRTTAPQPLGTDRFKVQFTAQRALREKIEEAHTLLRGKIPTGDLAAVFDEALTVLIRDLHRKRFGATSRPQPRPRSEKPRSARPLSPGSRHVPNAVKRAVHARDGGRCGFTDPSGRRCSERAHLEYHHLEPFARGGAATVDNIALRCRAHNAHEAERDFGFSYTGGNGRHLSPGSAGRFRSESVRAGTPESLQCKSTLIGHLTGNP